MNVLILGGTGAIGRFLSQHLSRRCDRIVITSRQKQLEYNGIEFIQGNAKEGVFMRSLLKNHWDCIVDFMIYSTAEFKDRVDDLLAATDHYFFLSSCRIFANSEEPLHEKSPLLIDTINDSAFISSDVYPLAKARQECFLFKNDRQNWTIIRPYITYSSSRLQLGVLEKEEWLYRALIGKTVIFSQDIIDKTTTLTHGNDVAFSISQMIGNSSTLGEEFNIVGSNPVRWESIVGIYKKALNHYGYKMQVKNMPLDGFNRCHNGKYQICYDRIYNRNFDNKKLNELVVTNNFIPPEEGLKECTSEFLNAPKFLEINWCYEGAKDRICGEFSRLGKIKKFKDKLRYLKYLLT